MSRAKPSWAVRVVKGFAIFWWDFLVGDTPELFVAALVIIAVVALLRIVLQRNALAAIALPVLSIVALGVSVRRARGAARK
jgi:hypothetical protein